jgi:hypothetical protein
MTRSHEKAGGPNPAYSDHGIVREKGEEQPKDKDRAQTVHKTEGRESVSKQETRKPKPDDA